MTNIPYCGNIFPVDINYDGFEDILAVSQTSNTVLLYLNNDNLTFSSITLDNNAGNMDVVAIAKSDNLIKWYKNDGKRKFSQGQTISDYNQLPANLTVTDFKKDGYKDLVIYYGLSKKILFKNDGNAQFDDTLIVASGIDQITTLKSIDFNADGFQEILL